MKKHGCLYKFIVFPFLPIIILFYLAYWALIFGYNFLKYFLVLPIKFILGLKTKDIDQMEGLEFEKYVASWLRSHGFKSISVTQGSGDFGVDITARKSNIKYAVQCKRYSGNVGLSAVQEVVAGMNYYGCQKGIVVTNSYFTKQAQLLADSNDVKLIDRDSLSKFNASSDTFEETTKNDVYFKLFKTFFVFGIMMLVSYIGYKNHNSLLVLGMLLFLYFFRCVFSFLKCACFYRDHNTASDNDVSSEDKNDVPSESTINIYDQTLAEPYNTNNKDLYKEIYIKDKLYYPDAAIGTESQDDEINKKTYDKEDEELEAFIKEVNSELDIKNIKEQNEDWY